MIIRIDDVSFNTDIENLYDLVMEIKNGFNPVQIILAVNVISRSCLEGSVYPGVPFKDKPISFFYNADTIMDVDNLPHGDGISVASHGLIHADHTKLSRDAQEMSILTSCSILGTKAFVPPFNRHNYITDEICETNGIRLMGKKDRWRSLDYHAKVTNTFTPTHKHWYMHPWRWRAGEFREKVTSKVGGFIPTHNGFHTKSFETGEVL